MTFSPVHHPRVTTEGCKRKCKGSIRMWRRRVYRNYQNYRSGPEPTQSALDSTLLHHPAHLSRQAESRNHFRACVDGGFFLSGFWELLLCDTALPSRTTHQRIASFAAAVFYVWPSTIVARPNSHCLSAFDLSFHNLPSQTLQLIEGLDSVVDIHQFRRLNVPR